MHLGSETPFHTNARASFSYASELNIHVQSDTFHHATKRTQQIKCIKPLHQSARFRCEFSCTANEKREITKDMLSTTHAIWDKLSLISQQVYIAALYRQEWKAAQESTASCCSLVYGTETVTSSRNAHLLLLVPIFTFRMRGTTHPIPHICRLNTDVRTYKDDITLPTAIPNRLPRDSVTGNQTENGSRIT